MSELSEYPGMDNLFLRGVWVLKICLAMSPTGTCTPQWISWLKCFLESFTSLGKSKGVSSKVVSLVSRAAASLLLFLGLTTKMQVGVLR